MPPKKKTGSAPSHPPPLLWPSYFLLHPPLSAPLVPLTHTRASFSEPARRGAHLSIAAEGKGVVALPGGAARGTQLVGQVAPLAQAAVFASRRGEPPQLPVLVHRVHDPVDARVLSNPRGLFSTASTVFIKWIAG